MRALATLWRTWFLLRFTNFANVHALANGPAIGVARLDSPSPIRIALAVGGAGFLVPGGSNCLIRAIAAGMMLRRYGYDSALMIGVAKSPEGGLNAHAWLESAGQIVIGDFELDRFVPLDTHRPVAAS
ncbi:MAG TPA: lasso peptide biosynthesis B2 protein [Candidatus Binataceae bacterium]|nr:lasso peptide biosynthesis B2 protein [Candidatus Binataceae bacterium]